MGFSEMPANFSQTFNDVDSGPVFKGFCSVASAFGIGAARANGRFDHSVPLTMEAVACSWPTPFGYLLPGMLGQIAADGWPLGETTMLFAMAQPQRTTTNTPFNGDVPNIVWLLLFGYSALGLLFLFRAWRCLNRSLRQKPVNQSEQPG